jgi:hypothetical protein
MADDQADGPELPPDDDADGEPRPAGNGGEGGKRMTRELFAQTVIERVRQRFPLVKIGRARQPFSVRVNGHVASLENLYRIWRLKPQELQHQIERWAVELLRASEGSPDRDADFEQIADRLLPMVLPCDEPREMPAAELPPEAPSGIAPPGKLDHLATQPLVPGLCVGYVIDGDRTISYVPWAALKRWDVNLERLHERALANLVGRSESMNAHAAQDESGRINLILFQTLDGFDASRLLLPSLHDRLREHLGSPFVAAIPNRDILLCFRNDRETVESLRDQINSDYRTMPHQVTNKLLLVTADGIAVFD